MGEVEIHTAWIQVKEEITDDTEMPILPEPTLVLIKQEHLIDPDDRQDPDYSMQNDSIEDQKDVLLLPEVPDEPPRVGVAKRGAVKRRSKTRKRSNLGPKTAHCAASARSRKKIALSKLNGSTPQEKHTAPQTEGQNVNPNTDGTTEKDPQSTPAEETNKWFACLECGEILENENLHNDHLLGHTEEHPKSVSAERERALRLKQEEMLQYRCVFCKERFATSKELETHTQIHLPPPKEPVSVRAESLSVLCPVCGKLFAQPCLLKYHMSKHIDERPFGCKICGKTFKQKSSVATHMASKHEGTKFICTICAVQLATKQGLSYHMRLHTGEKPHECSICQKRFAQPMSLRNHQLSHTEIGLVVQCKLCPKTYTQRTTLNVHMIAAHNRESKWRCSHCQKYFVSRQALQDHEVMHTGEKPFRCLDCGKSFGSRRTVKTHPCPSREEEVIVEGEETETPI